MLPEAAGRGQHFQARGHSFSLYIRTDPKPVNNMFIFFPWGKLAYKWICSRNFVIEFGLRAVYESTIRIKTINERVTQIQDKERCIKEQIYFELNYVSYI